MANNSTIYQEEGEKIWKSNKTQSVHDQFIELLRKKATGQYDRRAEHAAFLGGFWGGKEEDLHIEVCHTKTRESIRCRNMYIRFTMVWRNHIKIVFGGPLTQTRTRAYTRGNYMELKWSVCLPCKKKKKDVNTLFSQRVFNLLVIIFIRIILSYFGKN